MFSNFHFRFPLLSNLFVVQHVDLFLCHLLCCQALASVDACRDELNTELDVAREEAVAAGEETAAAHAAADDAAR